jgi:hypothetical protein
MEPGDADSSVSITELGSAPSVANPTIPAPHIERAPCGQVSSSVKTHLLVSRR